MGLTFIRWRHMIFADSERELNFVARPYWNINYFLFTSIASFISALPLAVMSRVIIDKTVKQAAFRDDAIITETISRLMSN